MLLEILFGSPELLYSPLLLVLLYLFAVVFTAVNDGVYFQRNVEVYTAALVQSHLAFTVVGCVVYFFFSCLMWMWAAKYSLSPSQRHWRLCSGVWAMFLLKDLPLLVIEAVAILQVGWEDATQCACFVVQSVFFFGSTVATSLSFAWYVAGVLERITAGATEQERRQYYRVKYGVLLPSSSPPVAPSYPPPLMLREGFTASPPLTVHVPYAAPYRGNGARAPDSPLFVSSAGRVLSPPTYAVELSPQPNTLLDVTGEWEPPRRWNAGEEEERRGTRTVIRGRPPII